MIQLAHKNFLRSKSVKIGLSFLLVAGIISLFVGKQFIEKQKQNVLKTAQYQREHIEKNVKFHDKEMGLVLYYLKFSFVNNTLPINALSIGQRDINPSIQSLTIRGLEAQKYDADLNNPYHLLLGNLDFSFVLIFLFPLLIIAFTYNIISEEKESGTWKIVQIQAQKPFLFILQLFSIRLIVIIGVLFFILLLAIPLLDIPLDSSFFTLLGLSILYILFWFGVCFWVSSLNKSSNFNAVFLLSIWLILLIILPTIINNYLVNQYPVPEALETSIVQRKGYHEKWDMDKNMTVNKFYAHYPQFKKYVLPANDFNYLWYYAMQQMGDDDAAKQTQELREKLEQRNTASITIAQFVPSIFMQIQLNEISKSGLGNQLKFMDETGKFHEQLRLYFYPKIFSESAVNAENWEQFKVETFTDTSTLNIGRLFMPLLAFILLFGGLGWLNYRKNIAFI